MDSENVRDHKLTSHRQCDILGELGPQEHQQRTKLSLTSKEKNWLTKLTWDIHSFIMFRDYPKILVHAF